MSFLLDAVNSIISLVGSLLLVFICINIDSSLAHKKATFNKLFLVSLWDGDKLISELKSILYLNNSSENVVISSTLN